MFIIAAEVYIFGAIMYIILGKGERQWWAKTPEKDFSSSIEENNDDPMIVNEINTEDKYSIQKPLS